MKTAFDWSSNQDLQWNSLYGNTVEALPRWGFLDSLNAFVTSLLGASRWSGGKGARYAQLFGCFPDRLEFLLRFLNLMLFVSSYLSLFGLTFFSYPSFGTYTLKRKRFLKRIDS